MLRGLTVSALVHASVLAMGYQRFIPNFAGLRFDMDDKGWHSFLAMDELENQPDFDFKPISAKDYLQIKALQLQEFITEKSGFYTVSTLVKVAPEQRDAFVKSTSLLTALLPICTFFAK